MERKQTPTSQQNITRVLPIFFARRCFRYFPLNSTENHGFHFRFDTAENEPAKTFQNFATKLLILLRNHARSSAGRLQVRRDVVRPVVGGVLHRGAPQRRARDRLDVVRAIHHDVALLVA